MTMTLPLRVPQPKDETLFDVAVHLATVYLAGTEITRRSLGEAMTAAFGATDASGVWSMRDAYDAMEAAQVLALKSMPASYEADPVTTLAALVARSSTLPTRPIAAKDRSSSAVLDPRADRVPCWNSRRRDGDRCRSRTVGWHRSPRRPGVSQNATRHPERDRSLACKPACPLVCWHDGQ